MAMYLQLEKTVRIEIVKREEGRVCRAEVAKLELIIFSSSSIYHFTVILYLVV